MTIGNAPAFGHGHAGYEPFLRDPLAAATLHYLSAVFAELCVETVTAESTDLVRCVVEPEYKYGGGDVTGGITVRLAYLVNSRHAVSMYHAAKTWTLDEAHDLTENDARAWFERTLEDLRGAVVG